MSNNQVASVSASVSRRGSVSEPRAGVPYQSSACAPSATFWTCRPIHPYSPPVSSEAPKGAHRIKARVSSSNATSPSPTPLRTLGLKRQPWKPCVARLGWECGVHSGSTGHPANDSDVVPIR